MGRPLGSPARTATTGGQLCRPTAHQRATARRRPAARHRQAKEKAQQAADQAKSGLRSQVDQRSTEAGDRVGGFASDVRSVGDQLREQGKEQPAKLAEQAADRAERLGDYLKSSDADRILADVEDFGRRQPWAVIAGGLALGIVASRFLKASSSEPLRAALAEPRRAARAHVRHAARPHVRRAAHDARAGDAELRGEPLSMAHAANGNAASPDDPRERPIGELVKDLSSQTSTLVRQEIELAKAELQQKGKVAGKGAGMLGGAAVAGLLALGALTAGLIALLDKAMATWVAALIVMALWAVVALVLAKAGQSALQRATPPAPQTIETVKEDIQWAKNPTGSAQR